MKKGMLAVLALGALSVTLTATGQAGLPKLAKKDTYKVGFAQVESNNPWRLAQTKSMQDEAKARGYQLVYTDAAGSAAKQVADVRSMIAQKVDLIFLAPREEKPLAPVVLEARKAGIPVILLDRNIDAKLARAGRDYVTFIGSDFILEGKRVGQWITKKTGGKANIIQLEGTTGSSPANDRKKGFDDEIAKTPGMKILASQTGDFARDKGRQVMETLLQANPTVNVVYAHNDEMAIGAISALEAAGKVIGKDVLVLSIDGGYEAVKLVSEGKIAYVVECNPKFGPKAFDTMLEYANGKRLPAKLINPDRDFTLETAAGLLPTTYGAPEK
jgi:galactofuranose transport system substrate-binding protein